MTHHVGLGVGGLSYPTWSRALALPQVIKGFAVPVNLQNSLLYMGGSLFAVSSFVSP